MNSQLGIRLRRMREERNMTQEQLAGRLGMSRQRLARLENGTTDITFEVLSGMAEVFGVSVPDLTDGLQKEPAEIFRLGEGSRASIVNVFEMLDLFYANKRAYEKVHDNSPE